MLRRGITGFDAEAVVEFAAFKRAVYEAALATGSTVIAVVQGNEVTPNFHRADVDVRERELSVICNRNYPVVAMVERPIEMSGVRPIDLPELVEPLRQRGFEVASAAELERPLEASDLALLSPAEQNEAKYWKPRRVADVVFNWWD